MSNDTTIPLPVGNGLQKSDGTAVCSGAKTFDAPKQGKWRAVSSLVVLLTAAGCTSKAATPQSVPQTTSATVAVGESASRKAPDWIKVAKAKPAAQFVGEGWRSLFNGETLHGWSETKFAGRGEPEVSSGILILNMGDPFTGLNFTNEFPDLNYEIALDAMRVSGTDFFCGLTLPIADQCCSLIVGGWGGSLVGISSVDGLDASENETTKFAHFEKERWYRLRVRVTDKRIEAWIDDDKIIDLNTEGKRLTVRPGDIELSKPVGIAAWQTMAAYREIRIRKVDGPADVARRPRS